MNRHTLPYLFLGLLFIIIVFIGGIQYGKTVNVQNQINKYISTLRISPTPTPYTLLPTTYLIYTHKPCGVSVTIPSSLTKEKESSTEASFKENTITPLVISCNKTPIPTKSGTATEEIIFKNRKTSATLIQNNYSFEVKHPQTGKNIQIIVDKNLYPLIESTLQFTP